MKNQKSEENQVNQLGHLNQAGSSRMDTVLKMLMIAFISLLAFSSGVYFGKQLSDSDYQLKALESDFNNAHASKTADAGHEANPEDTINQEEVAALSEKLVSGEKTELAKGEDHEDASGDHAGGHGDAHADTHAVANSDPHDKQNTGSKDARKVASSNSHGDSHADPHAAPEAAHGPAAHTAKADPHASKPVAHGNESKTSHAADHSADHSPAKPDSRDTKQAAHKPDLSAAAKAAHRVADNASPTEHGKTGHESRVPTSLPKTVGSSQDVEFTVQIASYPTAEAAKEHADELVKKGFPAFPVEASVNGKVWYRVSVGSFKTLREATIYRGQLVKQTTVPTAIVQKITR